MSFEQQGGIRHLLQGALSGLVFPLAGAVSDPRDEIIVRYTRGSGRFSTDKRYITLDLKMYKLSGEEDGSHQGVWHALFASPQELLNIPPMPTPVMDQPIGPVPHIPPVAQTKAIWTFGDGSSITAVGPALSHLIPLKDGSFVFMVTCAQIITNGTGRYEGCAGLKQSLGATHIPAGINLFGPTPVPFEATTVDTFRVVRRRYYRNPFQPPGGDGSQPSPGDTEGTSPDYPFQPKKIEVKGSTMSYIDEGSGEPILFLHGNPTWSYLWRNVIPELKSVGRCIAPDLIGMGRSDQPDISYTYLEQYEYLKTFIRKLGLNRVTLVLHDWGAALGFRWASLHPEKVQGLVFMEALVKPYHSWNDFPARNAPPQLRQVFEKYRSPEGYDLVVKQNAFMDQTFQLAGRQLSQEEEDYYQEPFRIEYSREVILKWIQQLPIAGDPEEVAKAVAEYSYYLQNTEVPKLLLYTKPGAIMLKEQIGWCEENLVSPFEKVNLDPQNQKTIHLLQEKYPRLIAGAIADWYRRNKSRAQ